MPPAASPEEGVFASLHHEVCRTERQSIWYIISGTSFRHDIPRSFTNKAVTYARFEGVDRKFKVVSYSLIDKTIRCNNGRSSGSETP